jgi:hypothetical protein
VGEREGELGADFSSLECAKRCFFEFRDGASGLGTKTKAQTPTRLTWMPLGSNLDNLQIDLFPQGW